MIRGGGLNLLLPGRKSERKYKNIDQLFKGREVSGQKRISKIGLQYAPIAPVFSLMSRTRTWLPKRPSDFEDSHKWAKFGKKNMITPNTHQGQG